MSDVCDLGAFIQSIKDTPLHEMDSIAYKEVRHAESLVGKKDPPGGKERWGAYLRDLKGFRYILSEGGKPAGISEESLAIIRPAVEALVGKGTFKASILENVYGKK